MKSSSQSRYGLFGKLQAEEGKGDDLAAILLEASRLVATATGCQIYLVSKDNQNENVVWITEVWDTQEDHDNSLKIAGVRELISKAIPLLAGPPEKGIVLTVLGGKGLD